MSMNGFALFASVFGVDNSVLSPLPPVLIRAVLARLAVADNHRISARMSSGVE